MATDKMKKYPNIVLRRWGGYGIHKPPTPTKNNKINAK